MLPTLVVILGPTGSGKSELAAQLASRMDGEVVSCDSVAVYRGLQIGTAKPNAAQLGLAAHHLLDVVGVDEVYSAGRYGREARAAVAEIAERRHVPVVAGGTGLYLRALLDGLFEQAPANPEISRKLEAASRSNEPGRVHQMLQAVDPAAAERIHPNDLPKLLRALSFCQSWGVPMTAAWQAGSQPLTGYHIVKVGLNPRRDLLYDRINHRAAQMFAQGLVDETRALIERYGAARWALQSLGYKQAQAVLTGKMTEAEAIAATAQGHRNYAKRQVTWFRREPDVHWLQDFGDRCLAAAEEIITATVTRAASVPDVETHR